MKEEIIKSSVYYVPFDITLAIQILIVISIGIILFKATRKPTNKKKG